MFQAFYSVFDALWANQMVQHVCGCCFVLGSVLCVLKLVNRGGLDG